MNVTEMESPMPISVLLVEDDPVFCVGFRAVLKPFDSTVTLLPYDASDVTTAIALTRDYVPDVVVLDLRLPMHPGDPIIAWEHGVRAIPHLHNVSPGTRILVLSGRYDADVLFSALKAGAQGYIAKEDRFVGRDLMHAILRIVNEETIFGPAVAKLISEDAKREEDPIEALTRREHEVLELLVQRKSNHEIATMLTISQKTVKTHVSNILKKLQLKRREEVRWHHYQRQHS